MSNFSNIPVWRSQVVIANTAVKALPTTGVEVIPAPGSGKRIILITGIVDSESSGAYTNIDAAGYAQLKLSGGGLVSNRVANDATTIPACDQLTTFLTAARSICALVPLTQIPTSVTNSQGNAAVTQGSGDNESVKLHIVNGASGNLTGGNSANTITVTLFYQVYTL